MVKVIGENKITRIAIKVNSVLLTHAQNLGLDFINSKLKEATSSEQQSASKQYYTFGYSIHPGDTLSYKFGSYDGSIIPWFKEGNRNNGILEKIINLLKMATNIVKKRYKVDFPWEFEPQSIDGKILHEVFDLGGLGLGNQIALRHIGPGANSNLHQDKLDLHNRDGESVYVGNAMFYFCWGDAVGSLVSFSKVGAGASACVVQAYKNGYLVVILNNSFLPHGSGKSMCSTKDFVGIKLITYPLTKIYNFVRRVDHYKNFGDVYRFLYKKIKQRKGNSHYPVTLKRMRSVVLKNKEYKKYHKIVKDYLL
jgi:hypothetical protein